MLMANPVNATIRPKANVAQATMGGRRYRSASQPMGTIPSTKKPPEIPATKVMALVLT